MASPEPPSRGLTFGSAAEAYERYRLGYPEELVDRILGVVYNASIMATKSTNTARRQGLDYGENAKGSTNGASLTLGFAAGPVTISGPFPFGGDGNLFGGYGRPQYSSSADQWYQTESNAGWKDCTHWRWCGSSDFQTQVHQGLFEFFHGDWNKTFPIDAQYATICSHPYGINC